MNQPPLYPIDYATTADIVAHAAMDWLITVALLAAAWMVCRRALKWLMRRE